ncbi:WYL domain-containing protein [Tateyamaria omphalii]|uniref:Uncharacterized protein n=1 Tax=Tateyamaria omphalii TaxID=299262 RepID=A0A1P8MWQ2_9RHOB|nr:WYL domain-containing protein [Tateyamaria omphalii]APX12433.1 hypothetical protein BWR18_12660 [Tateyamaria omphalii]
MDIKPSVRRRFEFIDFQLQWTGSIGRKALQDQFEISPQQATNDLTTYLDIAPRNMSYDPRRRSYVVGSRFKPKFSNGESSGFFLHLEMFHQGYRTAEEIWPTHLPQFDAVAIASRKVDPKILRSVLDAIEAEACLEVRYVSLSSDSETIRTLCPHAIASDGHRWHMRAYDVEKDRFSDFVLSRIETANAFQEQFRQPRPDTLWEEKTALRLQAENNLSPKQREQIEIEYSMVDGVLELPVRKAMLFYYLRFYGFDPLEMEGEAMRNKSSYRLRVSNLAEVERCLERRK